MQQYLDLMSHVQLNGVNKEDRTGTGTRSVFGHQMRFDLSEGFPLVTTKKCHLKSIIHELLWFLQGDTNIRYLKENGVRIWDEWADENGDLGPVYGYQWRSWPVVRETSKEINLTIAERCEEANQYGDYYRQLGEAYALRSNDDRRGALMALSKRLDAMGIPKARRVPSVYSGAIDQISNIVKTLKTNPDSRRIIVSAWNPALVDEMALPPCHALFQFYSAPMTMNERLRLAGGLESFNLDPGLHTQDEILAILDQKAIPTRKLSCQLYQRSADIFLGVPFNIASYALLTMMLAQVTDHALGDFIWTGGDCHLYNNHEEQVNLQLTRKPLPLPVMRLNPEVRDLFAFKFEDFTLEGYESWPAIKAPVAV